MKTKRKLGVSMTAMLILAAAQLNSLEAQPRFGLRGGANLDRDDLFLGAHAIQSIHRNWIFNPNFEYTFVDEGSFFTINSDVHYDIPSNSNTIFWVGGGLGISHLSFREQNNTDVGLNLLSGVSFGRGHNQTIPFVQVKVMVFDDTQLQIGGGITF